MDDKNSRIGKEIVQEAIKELKVEVPVYKAIIKDGDTVILHLYGGEIKKWKKRKPSEAIAQPVPVYQEIERGLTEIPGIGPATAKKLNDAGFHTVRDLMNDSSWAQLKTISLRTVQRIHDFLEQ